MPGILTASESVCLILICCSIMPCAAPAGTELRENTDRLCLQIAASSPRPQAARRAIACLEILAELGLVSLRRSGSAIAVRIVPHRTNPLENSVLFCTLRKLKAGD